MPSIASMPDMIRRVISPSTNTRKPKPQVQSKIRTRIRRHTEEPPIPVAPPTVIPEPPKKRKLRLPKE
jgi:hypothetical protein